MIDKHNFVYSKAAAARILGVSPYAIAKFEPWANGYFVQVKGKRPQLMSRMAFKEHFVEWRFQAAKSLGVAKVNDSHYRVVNPRRGTAYSVFVSPDGLECECKDYELQTTILGGDRHCCKHGYAVLSWLGCDRLSDYLDRNSTAA